MTIEGVNGMLREYRFSVGRCGHLLAEIEMLGREISRARDDAIDAMASPRPQQITDMPRGTQVGNPTERIGMLLASGYVPEDAKGLSDRIETLREEYRLRASVVAHVDSWLSGLADVERWVVEAQVIDGMAWRVVAIEHYRRFGEHASKDTLKRTRNRALEKIYRMAG